MEELHSVTRQSAIPRKQFEQLRGKLRYACIGIPMGKGLMGPINAELWGTKHLIQIKGNPQIWHALQDFGTLIHILAGHMPHPLPRAHCQ
jgi:hypothetical protein